MSTHSARYAAVAVAGGLLGFAAYRHRNAPPRQLTRDEALSHSDPRVRLAQCLSDKGYKLYGTSWCGWCKKQLDMFGPEGRELIQYIDCTRTDGQHGFRAECMQAGIRLVPSWGTPDGQVLQGTHDLSRLKHIARC